MTTTRIKNDKPVTVLVESQFSHSGYLDRLSFPNREAALSFINANWNGETPSSFWMEQRDGDTINTVRVSK